LSENTVVVKKIISARREEVFEAFTNPEVMTNWFYPFDDMSVDVTNTLEIGGSYKLLMHGKDGELYTHVGEYQEIEPPEKLVFTWNSDFVQNTIVTVTFHEADGGTEVTIAHDLLPDDKMREDHRGGWMGCVNRLEALLLGDN